MKGCPAKKIKRDSREGKILGIYNAKIGLIVGT